MAYDSVRNAMWWYRSRCQMAWVWCHALVLWSTKVTANIALVPHGWMFLAITTSWNTRVRSHPLPEGQLKLESFWPSRVLTGKHITSKHYRMIRWFKMFKAFLCMFDVPSLFERMIPTAEPPGRWPLYWMSLAELSCAGGVSTLPKVNIEPAKKTKKD